VSAKLASAALLAGALGMAFPFSLPWSAPHLPVGLERWLYNPREQTNAAIADAQKSNPESHRRAVAEADTALRLAPQDPLVQYDAGTVRLTTGDPRGAVGPLEEAARKAPPGLTAAAPYNLGNARLAGDDADGAIAAYRQALRAEPGNADAKWNLELALRRREDRRQMRGPAGARGGQGGGNTPSRSPGGDQKSEKDNRGAADPGRNREQQAGGAGERQGSQGEAQPRPGDQPLPQFRNQPDMTAAEAAALLESVENLERQQRRAQAAQRAERRAVKGKDW
jgi:Ca-activated chloride channel homolog